MGRARWPGGFVIPAIVSRLTGTTFRVPVMLQFGQTLPTDDTELPREQQTSMLAIITALLGARHLIVRTALLAVIIVGAFTLTAPRVFVSTSGVVVQGGRAPSSLSGLAAQFGVNVSGGDATMTVPFVASLLSSPELLRHLAADTLRSPSKAQPVASLYDAVEGEGAAQRIDRVARALSKDVRVAADPQTGVVQVRTAAQSAEVATALTTRLLTLGDSALVARRRQSASNDARYAAEQQSRAARSLRDAENALRAFLTANRRFSAPSLQLEQDRLQREVGAQQALVSALTQSAEQARIEAERPTPVLGIVEPASVPSSPEPRGLVSKLLLGAVGGGILGACLGLFLAAIARQARTDRQVGGAFSEIGRETLADLARPWRLVSAPRVLSQADAERTRPSSRDGSSGPDSRAA